MTRLLVVAYAYPPMPSVGANRWLAMAKYLRRGGDEVTLVTTKAFGRLRDDDQDSVVRVPDLTANPRVRRLLRRPVLAPGMEAETRNEPAPDLMTRVLVPDPWVLAWAPAAVPVVRRLLRSGRFDCLVTSSPYESVHLVGLAARGQTPWLADFRDGWTFEPHRPPFYTGAQTRLDRLLERRVLHAVDGVLAATAPIAEDFRARFDVRVCHVPNAWDPDLDGAVTRACPPARDPEKVNLVYTGKLSGPWGRNPWPFFEALKQLQREEPETSERLKLMIAGRLDVEEDRRIRDLELDGLVEHVGHLTRAEATALQRSADVLVLITSRNVSEATGKIAEYVNAGRPILALAENNEAARIVTETRTGVTVAPDDVPRIVAALRSAAARELDRAFAPRRTDTYRYPGPALLVREEARTAAMTSS